MTRNEALSKLPNGRWYGEEAQKGYFLDCLQVLGLIKFDEEKKVTPPTSIIALELGNYLLPHLKAEEIIKVLYKAGYKIVQKD